ncbi:MAG: CAP domain-containing protein, partial [Oscillospiraceae bacterium]
GVEPLRYVSEVDTPAQIRAEEASIEWSHTRPDGTNYNTIFAECGLEKYNQNGENLYMATYTPTPKEIVDAWISSKGHRENLLRKEFTGIGIGIYQNSKGEYYCSQLFIVD